MAGEPRCRNHTIPRRLRADHLSNPERVSYMMTATKTYPWGSITVTFEMTADSATGATLLAIMNAHTSIQKTLDMLAIATAGNPGRCLECGADCGGVCPACGATPT